LVAHCDRWDAILADIQNQSVLIKIEEDCMHFLRQSA
jgi:hypothetical protein